MPSLRERRHQQTKEQLVAVAFGLFAERGYENVSMEEVARAAGVSRSTAYRRFPTKEDLVLEVPRRWLAAFDEALELLATDASVAQAVQAVTLAVSRHIDDDHDTVRTAYAILDQAPALQRSGMATTAWSGRFVALVERFADTDAETAQIVAGAYLGSIDAMMAHWASTGGTASVAESSARLLVRLTPILLGVERSR